MNSDWIEHTYLKFLTTLWIFMGSSMFTNQEIQLYYSVNVDHNGMTAHLIGNASEGF